MSFWGLSLILFYHGMVPWKVWGAEVELTTHWPDLKPPDFLLSGFHKDNIGFHMSLYMWQVKTAVSAIHFSFIFFNIYAIMTLHISSRITIISRRNTSTITDVEQRIVGKSIIKYIVDHLKMYRWYFYYYINVFFNTLLVFWFLSWGPLFAHSLDINRCFQPRLYWTYEQSFIEERY